MSKKCPSCSEPCEPEQSYCGNCGQNLQAENTSSESSATIKASTKNTNEKNLKSKNKGQQNSKVLASSGIGCCSIFLGIGLGMAGIMLTATVILAPIGIPLIIQALGAFGIGSFGFGLAEHWSRDE